MHDHQISNIYDLHGQGVKCGNLQYILKRIFTNEEKKMNNQNEKSTFILDIGNEKDGEWHKHAKLLVLAFLSKRNSQYTIDDQKRYISIVM